MSVKARFPLFMSLRWRFIFPLALVVMLVAMTGAYAIASALTRNDGATADNILMQSAQTATDRLDEIVTTQRNEAARIAYSQGVAEAIAAGDATMLQPLMQANAQLANLDSVTVVNANAREMATIQRTEGSFQLSVNTDLSAQPVVQAALSGLDRASALARSPQGILLVTGVPLISNGSIIGAVFVGQSLDALAADLHSSSVAHISLYATDGTLGGTTFNVDTTTVLDVTLNEQVRARALSESSAVLSSQVVGGTVYRLIVAPWVVGQDTIGLVATTVPDQVPFATASGGQMIAIFAASLAAAVIIAAYVGVNSIALRLDRITATTRAITHGQPYARTRMRGDDEIGALGQAVDALANAHQAREDQLRGMLTRERRERFYLYSVLQAIPEAVIVQDVYGKILVMNDAARRLLGSVDTSPFQLPSHGIYGQAQKPGVYADGDAQQVRYHGKMLSAQAAVITTQSGDQLGTVMLVHDVTAQMQHEVARQTMLEQLRNEIEPPQVTIAQAPRPHDAGAAEFTREIARHSAALQKMIVDMHELTHYDRRQAQLLQRPLSVETLLWAVANDWRQIAQAANLTLQVTLGKKGLLVLGDESRLRLAIGNLIDNAIKYTPDGGTIIVEIESQVDHAVHLRVRDNGVGIHPDDLPHLFMPFYRGTPTDKNGIVIRVPGMGEGLGIARQLIEAHGGAIKVKSRAGVGTAVYFSLPLTTGVGIRQPIGEPGWLEGDTVMMSVPRTIRS